MKTNNLYHISYCNNLYARNTWQVHSEELKKNLSEIKMAVSPTDPMAIGLSLSYKAANRLNSKVQTDKFKNWLKENDFYISYINGIFYSGYGTIEKNNSYPSSWLSNDRSKYTITLANLLSDFLHEGQEGGISTSLGASFGIDVDLSNIYMEVAKKIWGVVIHLDKLYKKTGKLIHLGPTPELNGLIETAKDLLYFYLIYLTAEAKKYSSQGEEILRRHVRLGVDISTSALCYENIENIFRLFKQEEISVAKIQISSAFKILFPKSSEDIIYIKNTLQKFSEYSCLSPIVQLNKDGSFIRYTDLTFALENIDNPMVEEWRIPFNIPMYEKEHYKLFTTQDLISDTLDACNKFNYSGSLGIETYVGNIKPEGNKDIFVKTAIKELQWLRRILIEKEQMIYQK